MYHLIADEGFLKSKRLAIKYQYYDEFKKYYYVNNNVE